MSAENPAAAFVNQRLVAIDGLGDATRRVPIRHLGGFHAELEPLFARRGFGKSDGGDRR